MCGPRVQTCVDYCLGKAQGGECKPVSREGIDEDSAAQALVALGYSVDECTHALELTKFSFPSALKLLLFGGDDHRRKYMGKEAFRTQSRKGRNKQNMHLQNWQSIPCEKRTLTAPWRSFPWRPTSLTSVSMQVTPKMHVFGCASQQGLLLLIGRRTMSTARLCQLLSTTSSPRRVRWICIS